MSGVKGNGLEVERLERVGVVCVGGREEGRKRQGAKIGGWANQRIRVGSVENGKRRIVWELRSEGR